MDKIISSTELLVAKLKVKYNEAEEHVTSCCKTGYFYKTWIHNDKGDCLLEKSPD